ncbi:DUF4179 domain-containing protein [Psychrobacillus vulpis]|uniref:DUF4179 domain-containing protein n=1 Tax=Psychrobacillus vulpis TaxID=2325572 RepID=A0A544TVC9_9BACI|nr:DUF4179 domain-containing protein [Psychrobacillus vulpis]TQR21404.1 DUF4179 domain-containing protein [Psychrobacillus vulpis]
MSKLPIDVPKEKLQQVRMDTFRKVQREKGTKKRIVSVAVVSLFCFSLLFSIRVSPTIASFVAKIPGFEILRPAITIDKGLQDIVDNEYYEEINEMRSKNGLSLTLKGVIADQSGFVLDYDVDASFDISKLYLEEVQLFQGDDEMKCGCTFVANADNQTHISSLVEYNFSEPIAYTSKDFKAVFHFNDKDKGNIEIAIPFTLQNEIAKEKIITANRTVNVDGQKFTITQIRRSPLKVALDIEVDEENTMQILSLDDIAVVTESGERRDRIKQGILADGDIRDGKYTLYLQSNYFDDPESYTIIIGAVQAVPKGEDFIEVDFGTKEVLTKPDYFDWDISVTQQSVSVAVNKWDNQGRLLMLYDAVKEDGKTLEFTGSTVSRDEQYVLETTQFEDYDGKAKIYLNYYFNPIGENIELKIPLQ